MNTHSPHYVIWHTIFQQPHTQAIPPSTNPTTARQLDSTTEVSVTYSSTEHSTAAPCSNHLAASVPGGIGRRMCIRKFVLCPVLLNTPARSGVLCTGTWYKPLPRAALLLVDWVLAMASQLPPSLLAPLLLLAGLPLASPAAAVAASDASCGTRCMTGRGLNISPGAGSARQLVEASHLQKHMTVSTCVFVCVPSSDSCCALVTIQPFGGQQ